MFFLENAPHHRFDNGHFDGGFAAKKNLEVLQASGTREVCFSKPAGVPIDEQTSTPRVRRILKRMDRPRALSRVLLVLDGGAQPVDDCANPPPASRLGLTSRCPSRPRSRQLRRRCEALSEKPPFHQSILRYRSLEPPTHTLDHRRKASGRLTNADSHPFRTGTNLTWLAIASSTTKAPSGNYGTSCVWKPDGNGA